MALETGVEHSPRAVMISSADRSFFTVFSAPCVHHRSPGRKMHYRLTDFPLVLFFLYFYRFVLCPFFILGGSSGCFDQPSCYLPDFSSVDCRLPGNLKPMKETEIFNSICDVYFQLSYHAVAAA